MHVTTQQIEFRRFTGDPRECTLQEDLCAYIVKKYPAIAEDIATVGDAASKVVSFMEKYPDKKNHVIDHAYEYIIKENETTHYVDVIYFEEDERGHAVWVKSNLRPICRLCTEVEISEILREAIIFYLKRERKFSVTS